MTPGYNWIYAVHHPQLKELVFRGEKRDVTAAIDHAEGIMKSEGVRALVVRRGTIVFDTACAQVGERIAT